jgi:hypothetical protein
VRSRKSTALWRRRVCARAHAQHRTLRTCAAAASASRASAMRNAISTRAAARRLLGFIATGQISSHNRGGGRRGRMLQRVWGASASSAEARGRLLALLLSPEDFSPASQAAELGAQLRFPAVKKKRTDLF